MERSMTEKDLTGYCGLYCGDCIRYKCKASELSIELLNEIDNYHFREYANVKRAHTKEFEQFDSLIASLKAISGINCVTPCGAGGDGCGGSCEIIKCAKKMKLNGCWECNDFEVCGKLDFLKPFHGDSIISNLKEIKKHGVSDWAKFRDKCYPWL
jgi:hypothetical protein